MLFFCKKLCLWNLTFFSLAAGNAFSQAARLHLQMQSKHDAATNFIDAGNAFKKADADPHGCIFFYIYHYIKYNACLFYHLFIIMRT